MEHACELTMAKAAAAGRRLAEGDDQPAASLLAAQLRRHAAVVRSEADQLISALLEGLSAREREAILGSISRKQVH